MGVEVTTRFSNMELLELLGQCHTQDQVTSLFDTTLPEFIRENMRAGATVPLYLHVTFLNTSMGINVHREHFGEMKRMLYTEVRSENGVCGAAGVNWTQQLDTGWVTLVVWQSQLPKVTVETHRPDSPQISQGCSRFIDDQCTMCLYTFTVDDTVVCLPCFHLFHEPCIIQWRNSGQELAGLCPICRSSTSSPYTKWHIGRWHWSNATPP